MRGSVQEKNNKLYVVLSYKTEDGKHKTKWVGTGLKAKGNKREAEDMIPDIIKQYIGLEYNPNKHLFLDEVDKWLEKQKGQVRQSTHEAYRTCINAHIKPYFANMGLDIKDLTTKHLNDYYYYKFTEGRANGKGGLNPQTIKKHAAIFRNVLSEALTNGYVNKNVANLVKVPRSSHKKSSKKSIANIIGIDEANAIIRAFDNNDLQPLVRLTLMYGFRRSEVLGLKWSAINFKTNKIYVEHTVVKYTNIIAEDDTKTDESEAGLHLIDDARKLLLEVKAKQEEYRKLFGRDYYESDYIFTKPDGRLYRPDSLTRSFQRVLKKKGYEHIRFHDLRHATATILYAKDWKPLEFKTWMRHSDIRTTLKIYTHLKEEQMLNSSKSLNGLFSLTTN